MYPIPDHDANLRVMETLRAFTGVSVGYSDHTIGSVALCTAAAMGADTLEFHFTDSREGKAFRDHQVSLTRDEVIQLRHDIARITDCCGSGFKTPQASELAEGHRVSFRRGVYLSKSIKAGEQIMEKDLVLLRPAHGTDARDQERIIGAVALRDLEPYRAIFTEKDYQCP
jgi:N-acetylneuraminate synthase/N,N'-diacetyllegionaminate synthase